MKSTLLLVSLFVSTWAYAQNYQYAANRTQAQIEEEEYLESTPWVKAKTDDAKVGFAPIRRLMLVDPKAKILLNDVENTLKNHGIYSVEEIITVCQEDDENAGGFFSQEINTLDQRAVIPGFSVTDWSAETKEKIKTAYSTKILKLQFLEILMATTTPTVCVMPGQSLREAYGVFVHELTHFLKTDQYQHQELLMELTSYEEWLASTINLPGGEFDAFEADLGASARLLLRLGVTNPNDNSPYIDVNGNLTDPEGLREFLLDTYRGYYAGTETPEEVMIYPREFTLSHLDILENYIRPMVLRLNNAQVLMDLEKEIARLKTKKAGF